MSIPAESILRYVAGHVVELHDVQNRILSMHLDKKLLHEMKHVLLTDTPALAIVGPWITGRRDARIEYQLLHGPAIGRNSEDGPVRNIANGAILTASWVG